MRRSVTFAIFAACIAVMLSTGIRSSFGLFLQPLTEKLGTGRAGYGLAVAISGLVYGLPIVGVIADRFGSRIVLTVGGIVYVLGMLMMRSVETVNGLIGVFGVIVGIASSATTYVVVLGAIAQLVPPEKQSVWFGIITAAGSSGMFVVPPLAGWLLENLGLEMTFTILAGLATLIVVLALGLPKRRTVTAEAVSEELVDGRLSAVIKLASTNRSFWLLALGFFVCGFHVSFIGTHLPAFLSDNGLALSVGAAALSFIGMFNILGSYSAGWLGERYSKKYLLSVIYFGRAVVIGLFLLFPVTQLSAFIFASGIGFLWLATVPLTSGSIALIFGSRYLSTLFGLIFFSHQIGGFLGSWLAGRVYDASGVYTPIWIASIVLGIIASVAHFPIEERPLTPQPIPTY